MKAILLLAWRYVSHHALRTALTALCVLLVTLLPITVQRLVDTHADSLMARARATPLVVGAPGSRYDLVLSALYFRGRLPNPTSVAQLQEVVQGGLADGVPLHVHHTAQGKPVVGTSPEYYAFRGLRAQRGTLPLLLGDCVLGADVATGLKLGPGDTLLSDSENLYDLTLAYPLRMNVVGVLAATGTPDDGAVFVDVKTSWVMDGIGHGHRPAGTEGESGVLERREGHVSLNASIREAMQITPQNIGSFHFHGAAADLPLTAILLVPRDGRAATQLKGRYRIAENAQLLVPSDVVLEILGFLFRVKAFFDVHVALVAVATLLFLALIVVLTIEVRRRELDTLARIGCSRGRIGALLAAEVGITVALGLAAALALSWPLASLLAP